MEFCLKKKKLHFLLKFKIEESAFNREIDAFSRWEILVLHFWFSNEYYKTEYFNYH